MVPRIRLRRRWDKLRKRISSRILSLPEAMQEILLADFETAIENRLKIMEGIQGAEKRA